MLFLFFMLLGKEQIQNCNSTMLLDMHSTQYLLDNMMYLHHTVAQWTISTHFTLWLMNGAMFKANQMSMNWDEGNSVFRMGFWDSPFQWPQVGILNTQVRPFSLLPYSSVVTHHSVEAFISLLRNFLIEQWNTYSLRNELACKPWQKSICFVFVLQLYNETLITSFTCDTWLQEYKKYCLYTYTELIVWPTQIKFIFDQMFPFTWIVEEEVE